MPLWIAPDWPAESYQRGRFREHPAGVFLLPAALARLGYPAERAAYAVNGLYQVLTLMLVPLLAASFVETSAARRLAWLLQLLPIAFAYRARANHEAALLLCLAAALYATERARETPRFAPLLAGSLAAMALVKGLVVVPAALSCAAWLAVRGLVERKRTAPAWWGLAGSCLVVLVSASAYEALYQRATGESFLDYYLGRATRADPNPPAAVGETLYNLLFYGARVLWLAAPWSVAPLLALWRRSGASPAVAAPAAQMPAASKQAVGATVGVAASESAPPSPAARAGALFALATLAIYVGLFSLGERRAERYIFPVYFVAGAAGALYAMRRSPALERALRRLDSAYLPPLLWAATLALHLLAGRLSLPRIDIWAPDA